MQPLETLQADGLHDEHTGEEYLGVTPILDGDAREAPEVLTEQSKPSVIEPMLKAESAADGACRGLEAVLLRQGLRVQLSREALAATLAPVGPLSKALDILTQQGARFAGSEDGPHVAREQERLRLGSYTLEADRSVIVQAVEAGAVLASVSGEDVLVFSSARDIVALGEANYLLK